MNAPTEQAAEPELRISIVPRGYDEWRGTGAQLIAEGLIPAGFQWPAGSNSVNWKANGFRCWLVRRRPDGFKGPKKAWLELDNWRLRRSVDGPLDGFAAAAIHGKEQALFEEVWRWTPAGSEQFIRYWQAYKDPAFYAFKAKFMPVVKKPGQPRKAQREGGAS